MLSAEYIKLFKNDPNVAFLTEDLSNFAEQEIKEDSLISVIKRVLDALCDGEYLASVYDNDRDLYDLLLDCNYEGTDLQDQLFNELCD